MANGPNSMNGAIPIGFSEFLELRKSCGGYVASVHDRSIFFGSSTISGMPMLWHGVIVNAEDNIIP